jgi:hypothetical protein
MTKETLANRLNGVIYTEEMTAETERQAKDAGLVVVFGASDDLIEFRGAIRDEVGCYEGGDIFLHRGGPLADHDADGECGCNFCGWRDAKAKSAVISAIWDRDGYSWTYKTAIPHATFDVMEDNEKYCRGIVFNLADVPTL